MELNEFEKAIEDVTSIWLSLPISKAEKVMHSFVLATALLKGKSDELKKEKSLDKTLFNQSLCEGEISQENYNAIND